jgi:hypothetical protein
VVFLASIRSSVWGSFGSARSRLHLSRGPYRCSHHAGSTRPRSVRGPWQPLRKRSQSRRNYKVGCWHGVFGEHVRSFPNISGLTGATAGNHHRPCSRAVRAALAVQPMCYLDAKGHVRSRPSAPRFRTIMAGFFYSRFCFRERSHKQCEQCNHTHADNQHCECYGIVVQPIQPLLHGTPPCFKSW